MRFLKSIVVVVLLVFSVTAHGMSYFGSAAAVADNGTNTAEPVTITPPGSMVSGQLVWVVCAARQSGLTYTNDTTGGQTWTNHGTSSSTSGTMGLWSAIFNGTWSANPQWSHSSSAVAFNCIMHVFAPTSGYAWNSTADSALATGATTITTNPQTVTTTEIAAGAARRVALFDWNEAADCGTWAVQTAGWSTAGTTQYRVTDGSGISTSGTIYKFQTSSAGTGAVDNQLSGCTTGPTVRSKIAFSESASTPTFTVAPAVGTRTTSSIPITATTDCTDCTFYGVAYTDGGGTPTCTQIKAGQDSGGASAYKSFSQSMTGGSQGTGTFSTYTVGTIRDSAYCLNSTAGGDSTVSTIADIFKIPAFTSNPTYASTTSTSLTYNYTADGAGTTYWVACKSGETAPTVTQVEAAHCTGDAAAVSSGNESTTGASDSFTLGSLDFPKHSAYAVLVYGSQHEASVHSDLARFKAAPSGRIYDTLASVGTGSWCADITSPSAAAADVVELDSPTQLGKTVTVSGDCYWVFENNGARDKICARVYDDSVRDWMSITSPSAECTGTRAAVWYNNQAPIPAYQPNALRVLAREGQAMTPLDISNWCTDGENDTLVIVNVSSLPTGLSVTNNTLSGTPTTRGNYTGLTFRCTDITGASVDWQ